MYKQDNLTIHNEDCMKIMAQYEDGYFDLAVVDPPYGIDVTKMEMGGRKRGVEDKKKSWDMGIPPDEYFIELGRVSKNQVIWGGNYFNLPPSQYFCIWDKGETMYGRDFAECEYAWVKSGGTRIYKKNANQLGRIHPTQKPTGLYDFIYSRYAQEGQKILDTHLGSGSNAISAHYAKMGEFVGCELDKDYYEASIKRIYNETRQLELF